MQFRVSDSKAKAKFSEAGVNLFTETITIQGFPIHYAKTGSDSLPTLFFIHGSPGSWNAFENFMQDKELLARFRMISVDRPGFGYSRFGDAKNLAEQSKLIAPLIDLLNNNKPFYIAGHSLGGPMAVQLFIDQPDPINGLILLAASVDPAAEKPEKWRPVLYKTPLKFLVPGAFRPSNKELWFLKEDLKRLDTQWHKITCPVWIIHGDKDSFVPVSNADYAKQKLTRASKVEVTLLPGARHFIPWEQYNDIKSVFLHLPL
jgi:pimeloyl-ACP methyl ester carboxylesterase